MEKMQPGQLNSPAEVTQVNVWSWNCKSLRALLLFHLEIDIPAFLQLAFLLPIWFYPFCGLVCHLTTSWLCSGLCEHFQGCVSKESLSSSLLHSGKWPQQSLGLFLFQNAVLTLQTSHTACALWKHSHLQAMDLEMWCWSSQLFAVQPDLPSAFKERITLGYSGSSCFISWI